MILAGQKIIIIVHNNNCVSVMTVNRERYKTPVTVSTSSQYSASHDTFCATKMKPWSLQRETNKQKIIQKKKKKRLGDKFVWNRCFSSSEVMRPGFAHDSVAMKYDIVCSKEIPCREGRLISHNVPPPGRCSCCRVAATTHLGEISEVPRHGQVQLLWVVVDEDPGKDGVLVQVVVRPPWMRRKERLWTLGLGRKPKGWRLKRAIWVDL